MYFVKDANFGMGEMIKLHPGCFLVFAGNPPTLKYTGLNKFNVAFMDRMVCEVVPPFTKTEIMKIFEKEATEKDLELLYEYYKEIRGLITTQGLRAEISLRALKKFLILRKEMSDFKAIEKGFLNIYLTDVKVYETLKTYTLRFYKD